MGSCCTKLAARRGRDGPPPGRSTITAESAGISAAATSAVTPTVTPEVTPTVTPTVTQIVTQAGGTSAGTSAGTSLRDNPKNDTIQVSKMTLEDVDGIITQARPQLLHRLDLNIPLQAELERVGVITESLKDQLQPDKLTCHEKISKLLDSIGNGPIERFLWFCRILHTEGQGHLLQIMGVDINQIEAQLGPIEQSAPSASAGSHCRQKQHFYRDTETDKLLPFSTDSLPGILQHCRRCLRMLMRTPLFGFDADILLDVMSLYVRTTPEHRVNERELQSIGTLELFRRLSSSGTPNSVLLEGEPGSGKSTFLREYAHSVCKALVDCHNNGPDVPCPGHEWKLLIYISAWAIQGTQADAIRDSLECDEQYKGRVMREVTEDAAGMVVINDGVDELRNEAEKASTRQYTITCQRTGLPKILVSSRNGLCHIEGRYFDRKLLLQGFSPQQGLQYMEQYFEARYKLTDHPIVKYVEQHREEFEWILCNPLRLHILSELCANGKLTLGDMKDLSTIKLFRTLDSYILTRDVECREADPPKDHHTEFIRLCLECVLTDERRIAEDLISKKSPYLAFVNLVKVRDLQAKLNCYYIFIHEMFLEYHAVEGLVHYLKTSTPYKEAVLLFLCSNVNMRNVLKLTAEYICRYEPDLLPQLTFIMQACLILQSGTDTDNDTDNDTESNTESDTWEKYCKKTPLTEGLLQLPALVQKTFPRDVLSHGLTADQTRILDDVEKRVVRAFGEDAEHLQQAGWLLNSFSDLHSISMDISDYQKFVWRDLLQHCTPTQQEEICSQSTHRLLPCTRQVDGADFYMVPASSTHWTLIQLGRINRISTWCPQHVVPALTTLTQQHHRQLPPGSTVDLSKLPALWGEAPQEAWLPGAWTPALRQLVTHRVRRISINTPYNSPAPLDGLLEAAQEAIPHNHSLTLGLRVHYGWVSEGALCRCVKWARQVALKVDLMFITVVEREQPEGGCDQDVHSDIQHRVLAVLKGSTTRLLLDIKYQRAGQQ